MFLLELSQIELHKVLMSHTLLLFTMLVVVSSKQEALVQNEGDKHFYPVAVQDFSTYDPFKKKYLSLHFNQKANVCPG